MKYMMKIRTLVFLPCVLLLGCATQKDLNYVQGEVSQLKKESQIIKQQSAGSYSEITQYREEIAMLRGLINELRQDYQSSMRRLDMEDSLLVIKGNDLEMRLAKSAQQSDPDSTARISVVPAPDGLAVADSSAAMPEQSTAGLAPDQQLPTSVNSAESILSSRNESPQRAELSVDDLLNQGLVKMKNENYAGARGDFQSVIQRNPDLLKLADAQFYTAESYYGEKWYEKAILEYQVVIEKYTESAKRSAALYRQGAAFEKIGDLANAKARYKDVLNLYPESPEARLARKGLDER